MESGQLGQEEDRLQNPQLGGTLQLDGEQRGEVQIHRPRTGEVRKYLGALESKKPRLEYWYRGQQRRWLDRRVLEKGNEWELHIVGLAPGFAYEFLGEGGAVELVADEEGVLVVGGEDAGALGGELPDLKEGRWGMRALGGVEVGSTRSSWERVCLRGILWARIHWEVWRS